MNCQYHYCSLRSNRSVLNNKHNVSILPALCHLRPDAQLIFSAWEMPFCTNKNPLTSTCKNINIQLWAQLTAEGERSPCDTKECVRLVFLLHVFPSEAAAQGAGSVQTRGRLVAAAAPQILPIVPSSCSLHPACALAGCECLSCSELWSFGSQPRGWGYKL